QARRNRARGGFHAAAVADVARRAAGVDSRARAYAAPRDPRLDAPLGRTRRLDGDRRGPATPACPDRAGSARSAPAIGLIHFGGFPNRRTRGTGTASTGSAPTGFAGRPGHPTYFE